MGETCGDVDRCRSKKINRCNKYDNRTLPDDLVIEILLRLPVKSLLRFKTICKSWFNIINSPIFIDNHYEHHTNHSRLIVFHNHQNISDQCVSIFPDEALTATEPEPPSHQHLDYLDMPEVLAQVIGPVKGLFLICRGAWRQKGENTYEAAILNPLTRECRPLLVPYSNTDFYLLGVNHLLGFGFDPLTSDFKVVSLGYTKVSPTLIGAVYSLANDSWKPLQLDTSVKKHLSTNNMRSSENIYVSGSCYWMLRDKNVNSLYLLSFDLTTHVLKEFKGPVYDSIRPPSLFVYNNNSSIAALFFSPSQHKVVKYIDIMVMKEEGCWTKDIRLYLNNIQFILHSGVHLPPPRGICKDNNLFLEINIGKLVVYNLKTYKITPLGLPWCTSFFTSVYKPCLISVKGRRGNEEEDAVKTIKGLIEGSDIFGSQRSDSAGALTLKTRGLTYLSPCPMKKTQTRTINRFLALEEPENLGKRVVKAM